MRLETIQQEEIVAEKTQRSDRSEIEMDTEGG